MSAMNGRGHSPEQDDDQLVQRLRALDWPAVDPELKHQCWLELQERLRREAPRRTMVEGDRLEFSGRRTPTRGLVASARLGVAGGWLRSRTLSGLTPTF
jgi:hypothetical protein